MKLDNILTWIKDKAAWSFKNWWIVLIVFIATLLVIWFIVTLIRSIFRGGES